MRDVVGEWRRFLHRERIPRDAGLLLAVSGGRDSMVLAHGLWWLNQSGRPFRWAVATVNHRLRDNAHEDAEFVAAAARERWTVDCHVLDLEPPQERPNGLLAWARDQRYEALEVCRKAQGFGYVVTGHHAQDQAETILIRLARGGEPRGMPDRREHLLRPLLALLPADFQHFASKHALAWREDPSNADHAHLRARIRHQALPALIAASQTDIIAALAHWGTRLGDDDDYLQRLAEESLARGQEGGIVSSRHLAAEFLAQTPKPILRRALVLWLRAAGVEQPGQAHIETLLAERSVRLANGLAVEEEAGGLTLVSRPRE